MGRRLLLGLVFAAVFALPGQANAAAPFAPCKSGGVECATVTVPLDRARVVPGTINLHVEMLRASGQPRGVMFLIAGGPGQGSARSFDLSNQTVVSEMQFMFPGYTLVAFDNRGTGASGVLNCPALQATFFTTAEQGARLAGDCAAIIGPTRQFYATRDHAEDMDAVRQAIGAPKIALYGVSYGTKLALAYALAHPANVERLILDSVVQPSYPDPFYRNVLREMPNTLRNFCARGICRGATSNFAAEFVALANKIEARPIQGKVVTPSGGKRTLHMNGEELVSLMIDADLSPGLAAELPAAVHAARGGYNLPLLRLLDLDARLSTLTPEDLSFGLNAATNCADGQFPWSPATPPGQRQAAIDQAVAGLLPGSFGPFGNWAARLGTAYFCEQWPSPSGNTPLGPGPFPNVPVLAVNGGFDMRTPVASAAAVVDQFPQGRLIVVPGVGHSVLSLDFSGCSQNATRAWILGTLNAPTRAMCPAVAPLAKVLSTFPRRAAGKSAAATLVVASKAVREAQATWLQLAFGGATNMLRGLYGGKLVSLKAGNGFTLNKYSVAPGVFVTGKLTFTSVGPPIVYKGSVRVSGPAVLPGTLTFSKNAVSGTLGGKRVRGAY